MNADFIDQTTWGRIRPFRLENMIWKGHRCEVGEVVSDITENGRFRVQKNGTSDAQIQNRRPLFVANYPQKSWNRLLFHMNIIFSSFLQISKIAYFRLIIGRFPIVQSQNQKPMMPSLKLRV